MQDLGNGNDDEMSSMVHGHTSRYDAKSYSIQIDLNFCYMTTAMLIMLAPDIYLQHYAYPFMSLHEH
jgi:hypothetical protein